MVVMTCNVASGVGGGDTGHLQRLVSLGDCWGEGDDFNNVLPTSTCPQPSPSFLEISWPSSVAMSCQWVPRGLGRLLKCPGLQQTLFFPAFRFPAPLLPSRAGMSQKGGDPSCQDPILLAGSFSGAN